MSIFKRTMSTFVFINDLLPSSDSYKLRVRVVTTWTGFKAKGGCSLEAVLVDEKGDRIHATVDRAFVKRFQKELVQGHSVCKDTFRVVDYKSDYRVGQCPFKMVFYETTAVAKCLDFKSDVPEKYFKNIVEVISGVLDRGYLIDVMGQIIRVGHLEDMNVQGKRKSRLLIDLRDETDSRVTCTLWEDYAKQVFEYANLNSASTVVCVIRFACIRKYNDVLIISNAYNTTRVMLDPKDPLVERFRSKLPSDKYDLQPMDDEQSDDSYEVLYEEFFSMKYHRKMLGWLKNADEVGKYTIIANVYDIGSANNWFYIACKSCNKKVLPYPDKVNDADQPLWKCLQCRVDVSEVVASYMLSLKVNDHTGETVSLLIFDRIATKLFKKMAEELYEDIDENSSHGFPDALWSLKGKDMLFKVTVTDDHLSRKRTTFIVDRLTDDDGMVDRYRDQFYSQVPIIKVVGKDDFDESRSPDDTSASDRPVIKIVDVNELDQGSATKKRKGEVEPRFSSTTRKSMKHALDVSDTSDVVQTSSMKNGEDDVTS